MEGVKLQGSSVWHHCVLEVTARHEGPRKQWRNKGNMKSNMTEHATLLKQQSKENTDRVSPGQKIEQGVLLLQLLRLSCIATLR